DDASAMPDGEVRRVRMMAMDRRPQDGQVLRDDNGVALDAKVRWEERNALYERRRAALQDAWRGRQRSERSSPLLDYTDPLLLDRDGRERRYIERKRAIANAWTRTR